MDVENNGLTENQEVILQGTTRAGDFVHQNQTMAKTEGFANVSKIWFDKTLSIDSGLELMAALTAEREDILAPWSRMTPVINDDGKLAFQWQQDERLFLATEHATLQYATWAGVSHAFIKSMLQPEILKPNGSVKFVRDEQDTETLLTVLENGARRVESDKAFLFRTYRDGTLRAVLTDGYSPVDNRWYLETLKLLMPDARLSHWTGDADTIYGNLLIPDSIRAEDDSDYGGMISCSNSEIGTRRFGQTPSIFRAICMNGCIWDQTEGVSISQVHKGVDLSELSNRIKDNINNQIPLMQSAIDNFLALRDIVIASPKRAFALVAEDYGLNSTHLETCLQEFIHNEGKVKTAFGVVNAITRAGQKFENETWNRFDVIAGQLMSSDWEKFNARASLMSDERISKLYGVSA